MTITSIETTVYQTSDGRRFTSIPEAGEHELDIWLDAWAEKHGLCAGGEWTREMVLSCIKQDSMALAISLAMRHGFDVIQPAHEATK